MQKKRAYALTLSTGGVLGLVRDSQELSVGPATRPSELKSFGQLRLSYFPIFWPRGFAHIANRARKTDGLGSVEGHLVPLIYAACDRYALLSQFYSILPESTSRATLL